MDEVDPQDRVARSYRWPLSLVPHPHDKPPPQRTIAQLFSAVARIDGLGRATVLPQL